MNESAESHPRIAVICHDDDPVGREILPKWAETFGKVVAIVAIDERRGVLIKRLRSEIRRAGMLRMLDVLAFRVYYRLFMASADAAWQEEMLEELRTRFRETLHDVPVVVVDDPNNSHAFDLLRKMSPDLIIARCRWLLKGKIYNLPRLGTFVLHPGICPEYRNAHGCFWALMNGDKQRVGMTLLKIDDGIDTGPAYAYFSYPFDACNESHIRIQIRMFTENLDAIREALEGITSGSIDPIDVAGRKSQNWGQPWLSAYLDWKRANCERSR